MGRRGIQGEREKESRSLIEKVREREREREVFRDVRQIEERGECHKYFLFVLKRKHFIRRCLFSFFSFFLLITMEVKYGNG